MPATPAEDAGALVEGAAELIQPLTVRYRGALPRRGFLQRLAEGRRSIFTVLMLFSLFGSFLGFNWRTVPILGLLFLCGFIVAVVQTYRSWVDEDAEHLDSELNKLREQLRAEVRRVLGEWIRELQAALLERVESRRRVLLARLEEAAREAASGAQRQAQAARELAQSSLRRVETREQRVGDFAVRLARLDSEMAGLRGQLE